jgi:anti-sigma factor RsiW
MNCETWQDRIDAFVDNELTSAEAAGFEEHLSECPACSAETRVRQRMKIDTRMSAQRYAPTPEFQQKIASKYARRQMGHPVWASAAGALAMVVLVALAGFMWRRSETKDQLFAQLLDQHVATLSESTPLDVRSNDVHTVAPWFSGKVPFTLTLPELQGTPYSLVGAKLTYFQEAPAAQLVFGVRQHRISVFMFRDHGDTAMLGDQQTPVRTKGFASQTWVEDGVRYFAVSDAEGQDVRRLCEMLKDADRS